MISETSMGKKLHSLEESENQQYFTAIQVCVVQVLNIVVKGIWRNIGVSYVLSMATI